MAVSAVVRKRLEAQGYRNLDDATLADIGPWLRWTYAICTLLMITGTVLASPAILWTLSVIALIGAILPFHPFDWLYNYGFRFLTGTGSFPRQGAPRRFACGLAAVWLIGTGLAFYGGATVAGYVLGAMFAAVGVLVSTTYFCIPSLIYNTVFGSPGKAG